MINLIEVIFFAPFVVSAIGQLIVTLPNGKIEGYQVQTYSNKTYNAYKLIPFATAPLGNLRFQAPQPAQNWSGIFNASRSSPICFQLDRDSRRESEDCLYIQVYTPVLNADKNNTKLPVDFWIYGGGLRNGAAGLSAEQLNYWIEEDIVVVTANYRVGIFGFLSTGDNVVSGNNGLKDQVLALKWTYENIHLFGGDQNKITIHGQSAGSVSASYHLLIKQSAGMFRAIIGESGSAMNMYAFLPNPKDYALQLAQGINPNISSNASSEEIREFLLSLSGRNIDKHSHVPKIVQPGVVIEPESPTAVVTSEMFEMFNSGNFTRVPVLIGMNSEEGLNIANSTEYLVELGTSYDSEPSLVVPDIFPRDSSVDIKVIGEAVKLVYMNATDTWANKTGRVVRHFSDQRYTRAIIKQGVLISKYSPVYFYQFSYVGDRSSHKFVKDAEKVRHAAELSYVFTNLPLSHLTERDALTSRRIMKMWINMVKYGDPTPEPIELLQNITWPKVSPTNYQYLNINDTLSIKVNPKEEFFSKWETVFKTYGRRPFTTY